MFTRFVLFLTIFQLSYGQLGLLNNAPDTVLELRLKQNQKELRERKPGKGIKIKACNAYLGDLMMDFTSRSPGIYHGLRNYQDVRMIIFGQAHTCVKKVELYEEMTAANALKSVGDGSLNLEDLQKFKDVSKATDAVENVKKKVKVPGLCEEEYLVCKKLLKDVCNVKKEIYVGIGDYRRFFKQIRFIRATKEVCKVRDELERIGQGHRLAEVLGVDTSTNPPGLLPPEYSPAAAASLLFGLSNLGKIGDGLLIAAAVAAAQTTTTAAPSG